MRAPSLGPWRLIGMVHVGPLPGAPHFDGDLDSTLAGALLDARRLADAGFDALMMENFGDAPFFADDVPKVTVAAMTRVATAIREAVDLPLGINVLRNDALAAVAVAAASGASFIRVNVLAGTMSTDQGPITGRPAEVARLRAAVHPTLQVLADVFVKHAVPPPGLTLSQAARDLWERGGADGIVASGSGTGHPVDFDRLHEIRKVVPDAPLFVGSGVDAATVAELLEICSGVIVGTSVKEAGLTTAPVDPERAAALVKAAG
ncbi:MAG: BtpA/SgcQ family protein [Acidimicrobiia bacterium]